jgi:hypothetical protein
MTAAKKSGTSVYIAAGLCVSLLAFLLLIQLSHTRVLVAILMAVVTERSCLWVSMLIVRGADYEIAALDPE